MEGPKETNEGSEEIIIAACDPADDGILTNKDPRSKLRGIKRKNVISQSPSPPFPKGASQREPRSQRRGIISELKDLMRNE